MAKTFAPTNIHRALTHNSEWLNTSRPLQSEDLAGRILLLDFWTFCCINCIHVIPDLQKLEAEFGNALTVIGIHSAKFENEKGTENIRSAILRYEIEHAVINDSEMQIWRTFGVRSWPTLALINPNGLVEEAFSGEGHLEELRRLIRKLLAEYAGSINTAPLPYQLEKEKAPPTELLFPGKMEYAEDTETLFIADSNNNRIVAADLTGKILYTVGQKGRAGASDGRFDEAEFFRPQGMAYLNKALYVADTENHLLRKVDIEKKIVATIAGTGKQGVERRPNKSPALQTPMSSPWDLSFYPNNNQLAIAMAGTHQLWSYHLESETLSVLAGNGNESIDDGAYPRNSLSQPSGLSTLGAQLYFVDSETSALRVLEKNIVRTLIGTGLFDFGLRDGDRTVARMQHSIGLFADYWAIYIADTYNHAIRRYDVRSQQLETLCGNGKMGFRDGKFLEAQFFEPNDIIKIGGNFYVADTNNHQIRVLDIARKQVSTLRLLA